MTVESPDTIHGRMKEGAHLAAYSVARVMDNLKYLLEDGRFYELSAGYKNVNEFLRDTQRPFEKLKISPEERKEIAQLVKDLQPDASQRAIADMVGKSEATIARDLGSDRGATNVALDTVKEPEIATNVAPQPWTTDDDYIPTKGNGNVHFSSASNEWNTPGEIVERVVSVLGSIDLDPCADDEKNIPAKHHLTKADDGLTMPWLGRVYMNPPYGNEIADWIHYLVQEFENGHTLEAVALVPSRTDTAWFRELRKFPRCFIWGRLKFGDGANSAPFPSMAVYLGGEAHEFRQAFGDIGDIYEWCG